MGFNFRKSIKVGKNTRINLSKSGIGISGGVKGARISVNQKGTRTTLSVPGTGISHTSYKSHGNSSKNKVAKAQHTSSTAGFMNAEYYSPFLAVFWVFLTVIFFATGSKVWGAIFGVISIWLIKVVISNKNKAYKLYKQALRNSNEEEKIELLKRAKEIDNANNLVNNMLAYIYFEKGDNGLTLTYIDDIEDLSSLNEYELNRMYIVSLFKYGEYQEVIDRLEDGMESDLFNKLRVALSYKELGQVKKASEILATGPVNKRTYSDEVLAFKYHLGLCYLELEDVVKAKRQLVKVYEADSSYEDIIKYAQELGFAVGEHSQ